MMGRTWSSEAGVLSATGEATRSATVSRQPVSPAWPKCSVLGMVRGYPPGWAPSQAACCLAGGECLTHGRHDLGGEALGLPELVLVVEPGDEAVEAQVARELHELLDPVVGGAAQPVGPIADHAVEVRHPPDRRRLAGRLARGLVDRVLLRERLVERQPRQRRDPAVGE